MATSTMFMIGFNLQMCGLLISYSSVNRRAPGETRAYVMQVSLISAVVSGVLLAAVHGVMY